MILKRAIFVKCFLSEKSRNRFFYRYFRILAHKCVGSQAIFQIRVCKYFGTEVQFVEGPSHLDCRAESLCPAMY